MNSLAKLKQKQIQQSIDEEIFEKTVQKLEIDEENIKDLRSAIKKKVKDERCAVYEILLNQKLQKFRKSLEQKQKDQIDPFNMLVFKPDQQSEEQKQQILQKIKRKSSRPNEELSLNAQDYTEAKMQ